MREWVAALGAGVVSAVTLAAFAAFSEIRAGLPVTATYSFLASAVGGTTFGEGPAAVPVGVLVLHDAVRIGDPRATRVMAIQHRPEPPMTGRCSARSAGH